MTAHKLIDVSADRFSQWGKQDNQTDSMRMKPRHQGQFPYGRNYKQRLNEHTMGEDRLSLGQFSDSAIIINMDASRARRFRKNKILMFYLVRIRLFSSFHFDHLSVHLITTIEVLSKMISHTNQHQVMHSRGC